MQVKLSVIVPVYNTEAFIRQCLDSIVEQTFRDFEMILVDDGSLDNCGQICDEYAARDPRIRVLHKQNQGLSAAWNDGIRMARGEWIAFVDSDDWIDQTFFEKIMKAPDRESADILVANGYYREMEDQCISESCFETPLLMKNGEGKDFLRIKALNVVSNAPAQRKQKGLMSCWNKFYKASFIQDNQLWFDTRIRAGLPNDGVFNFVAFDKANVVAGISCTAYHYRIRKNSGTRKYDPDILKHSYYVVERLYEIFDGQEYTAAVRGALSSFTFSLFAVGLSCSIFHPENHESFSWKMKQLKEKKNLPYYAKAIHCGNRYWIPPKRAILKNALRLPWGLPVYLLYCIKKR